MVWELIVKELDVLGVACKGTLDSIGYFPWTTLASFWSEQSSREKLLYHVLVPCRIYGNYNQPCFFLNSRNTLLDTCPL